MLELLATGSLRASGFLTQEEVPLDAFLGTSAGQMLAGGPSTESRDGVSLMPVS
jgi:hypothetical protein